MKNFFLIVSVTWRYWERFWNLSEMVKISTGKGPEQAAFGGKLDCVTSSGPSQTGVGFCKAGPGSHPSAWEALKKLLLFLPCSILVSCAVEFGKERYRRKSHFLFNRTCIIQICKWHFNNHKSCKFPYPILANILFKLLKIWGFRFVCLFFSWQNIIVLQNYAVNCDRLVYSLKPNHFFRPTFLVPASNLNMLISFCLEHGFKMK